jgi:protein-tyrosine-phosphatase
LEVQVLPKRRFGLAIWGLGLGYYLSYTPYAGLTKALSGGLLPITHGPVKGTVLLPVSVIATAIGMLGFITAMRWWRFAGRREFFGISVPFPRRLTFLSGVCMATIMATTTLAFTFGGLSIVLVLVLLRGGTLIIAPLVDAIVGRRVRWFSWTAMVISLIAVLVVLNDATNYKLTVAAIIDIAAYLAAYFFKLQFMSRLAKSDDQAATRRYFVEEQMVAAPLLVMTLVGLAFIGIGDVMQELRFGLTTFLASSGVFFAALVGLCYATLCVCTTLIFLDRRENTFCVPLHCGSSMLSGFTASLLLFYFFNQSWLSGAQTLSAGLIGIALGFLSPLHHFDRVLPKLKVVFARQKLQPVRLAPALADRKSTRSERLILFVCSGNTSRSPMAAAIANAEIARRHGISYESLAAAGVKAASAGITAKVGEPMTVEAKAALKQLGFEPNGHRARSVTVELANQAERIFCMAESQRVAVANLVPSVAGKAQRLDPNGDIEDPSGGGLENYVKCAQRLHELVKLRFDECGIKGNNILKEST